MAKETAWQKKRGGRRKGVAGETGWQKTRGGKCNEEEEDAECVNESKSPFSVLTVRKVIRGIRALSHDVKLAIHVWDDFVSFPVIKADSEELEE